MDESGMDESAVENALQHTTDTEKLLMALYPTQALAVYQCAIRADEITWEYYPGWNDGDEGNAFRHAMWNALMKRRFGSDRWAEMWANAHEAFPDEVLAAQHWNGFDAFQHREMDLHNNELGRNCVQWYEFWISDDEIAERIIEKIKNGEGMILVE